jgi:oxygen-independent coproporphyrinogen III oxidase
MAGIYISYPFCSQKCTYCNFASGVLPRQMERPYVDAVVNEIRHHEWKWKPETLYLGGGTPSQMEPEGFAALTAALGREFQEATLEAAPGSVEEIRIRAWLEAGINRVSFGVQSFIATELARTGRKHRADTVVHDLDLLARHGITNVNLDLIAGLPGQTRGSWRESLDWIERLAPMHVSIYMLEVDDDSNLGGEILRGGAKYGAGAVPSEELIVEFYETAVDRMAAIGIPRYEISNFARPGFESKHNLKYWRMEPYVGFGADAHSFDGRMRWQNVESAADYVALNGLARSEESAARLDEERMFTGLRLDAGIRPEAEQWRAFAEPIRRRIEDGLLEADNGVLRLTRRGVLYSNEVFSEFVTL